MAKRTRRTLIVSKPTLDAALSEPGGLNKLMRKARTMATLNFEIIDHGVEHAQYFQGCGVAFTAFTHVATGAGESARQAAEDALEQAYMDPTFDHADTCPCAKPHRADTQCSCHRAVMDAELDVAVAKLSDTPDAHTDCPENDEECEMHHYVSIRWSVTP